MPTQSTTDTFSYGDVTLSFPFTRQFAQLPDTEPSGTDQIWTRTRLTVQGIVAYNILPSYPGQTIQQTLQGLEHRLLAFRQRMRYRLGGVTVLSVDPPPASPYATTPPDTTIGPGILVDCENGPKPVSVSFPLVLAGSCVVEFTVEFAFVNCPSGVAQQNGFASNRFTQTEDYDQVGYRTISTNGLLIGRSDLVVVPDQLRGAIVPAVPNGHQRMSSRYTLSEDGLRLAYAFVDKEYYLGPPSPAKKATGIFLISANNYGGNYIGQCTVRLEAGKDVAKRDLMNLAVLVARSRINLYAQPDPAVQPGSPVPIMAAAYSTPLYENAVEVMFRCRLDPSKIQQADLRPNDPEIQQQVAFGAVDNPLPGSPAQNQWGIAPAIRGFLALPAMIAQVFQDPCMAATVLVSQGPPPMINGQPIPPTTVSSPSTQVLTGTPGAQFNPFPQGGQNVASISVGTVPLTPPPPATVSTLPYEFYHIRIAYKNDTGKRALDSTGVDSSGNAVPRPVIQLRNPKTDMHVTWTASRIGDPPEIPDPCPASTNFNLSIWSLETEEPQLMPTGTYKHTISGHYEYNVLNPCLLPLIEAVPPFLIPQLAGIGSPPTLPPAISPPTTLPPPGPTPVDGAGTSLVQYVYNLLLNQDTNPADLGSTIPPVPTSPPPPATGGNQPAFNFRQDIVWWRLLTVAPGGLFCGCGTPTGFQFGPTSSSQGGSVGGGGGSGGGISGGGPGGGSIT